MFYYPSLRRSNSWGPLSELPVFSDLRSELAELERFFDNVGATPKASKSEFVWSPRTNVEETENHFMLRVETPGVKKDDLKIEIANSTLTIGGERREGEEGNQRVAKFSRSFSLPTTVDVDKIEANYQDGILHVMIPKAEAAKPKQVKIGQSGGSKFFGKLIGSKAAEEDVA